ncbi:MAG: lipase family protein [Pirellulaceae bacterium]
MYRSRETYQPETALAPPGGEETDIVTPNTDHNQDYPTTAIERLQMVWDSEEREALWPASETLAVISDAAYLAPVDAQKKFLELGFPEFMPIVAGSMIGYVISGGDVTVVAFRGTDFAELSDWIANFRATDADTPHGAIHSGFNDAYASMKPQIAQILAERNTTHLWVTGHSLGGAIAVVCAYDFVKSGKHKIDGIMTFGQPRVAREELAGYIDHILIGRFARFVNGDDLVPKIPSSHAFCGSLVWFKNGCVERSKPKRLLVGAATPKDVLPNEGSEIIPLSDEEFARLQAELKAQSDPKRLPDEPPMYQGPPRMVEDHSMILYLEKVRSHLGLKDGK